MSLKNKIKMFSVSESGRSMVEMLGVLAIIGVLSIGAVAGYKFALNKFRANEIINELNMRALSISSLLLNTDTPDTFDKGIKDGFGDTLATGYSVKSHVSCLNADYFDITVYNVPSEVCVQILRDYENPMMIFVGGKQCDDETQCEEEEPTCHNNETRCEGEEDSLEDLPCVDGERYNNDTALCATETGTVKMIFNYRNDLGERETCSERGYFGEEDFMCHCAGNTYIDPDNPNECLCPAGHVWSGDKNTCIKSICKEREFLTPEGCIACTTSGAFTLNYQNQDEVDLCNACPNRYYHNAYAKCLNKNDCDEQQVMDMWGTCHDCSRESDILLGVSDTISFNVQQCLACNSPNEREILFGARCMIKNKCTMGVNFHYQTDGAGTTCEPCNSTKKAMISKDSKSDVDPEAKKYCEACVNAQGIKNRTVSGRYCIKTTCESDEFMGADGQCHECTEKASVSVGTDEALITDCTKNTCGRVVEDGKCVLSCPTDGTHIKTSDGGCYPCNQGAVVSNITADECAQCTNPTRFMLSDTQCSLEGRCKEGTNYWQFDGSYCAQCTSDTIFKIKNSITSRDFCNNCTTRDRHALVFNNTAFCVPDDKCGNDGTQFLASKDWSSVQCYSCDFNERARSGTQTKDRQQCLNCTTTKRFWNDEYCYRCDTVEVLDITSDEEIASCKSCLNRDVVNNQCVLKQ